MTFLPSLAEMLFLSRLIPPELPQPLTKLTQRCVFRARVTPVQINGLGIGTAAWPEGPPPTPPMGWSRWEHHLWSLLSPLAWPE